MGSSPHILVVHGHCVHYFVLIWSLWAHTAKLWKSKHNTTIAVFLVYDRSNLNLSITVQAIASILRTSMIFTSVSTTEHFLSVCLNFVNLYMCSSMWMIIWWIHSIPLYRKKSGNECIHESPELWKSTSKSMCVTCIWADSTISKKVTFSNFHLVSLSIWLWWIWLKKVATTLCVVISLFIQHFSLLLSLSAAFLSCKRRNLHFLGETT